MTRLRLLRTTAITALSCAASVVHAVILGSSITGGIESEELDWSNGLSAVLLLLPAVAAATAWRRGTLSGCDNLRRVAGSASAALLAVFVSAPFTLMLIAVS